MQEYNNENMSNLTDKEALEAKKRRKDYEHDLAIEGLSLHPDDQKVIDKIDQNKMNYDEGVNVMIDHLKEQGVIPSNPETETTKEKPKALNRPA